ncbi:MAG: hypothetical protein ABSF26_26415 [Thermoguttaceae bacterium]|jgi:hypothetical protein
MSVAQFNREEMARWYADRHLNTDPGIRTVYYLPAGAPDREIRFLEINDLMAVRENDPLEPIDFGVDIGGAESHTLLVLDVTPAQWDRIHAGALPLPDGWSLDNALSFSR